MINDHVSDTDIQQFVLDKPGCDSNIIDHMLVCESCKEKAGAYQLLFSAIQAQESPAFDFDLAGLVLSQLEPLQAKQEQSKLLIFLFVILGISSVAIAGWLFGDYFSEMFTGLTSIIIYLALTVAVTFLVFQGVEMYKKYQKQMDALNFN